MGRMFLPTSKSHREEWMRQESRGWHSAWHIGLSASIHGGLKAKSGDTFKGKEGVSFMALKYTVFSFKEAILQPAESNCYASSAWIPPIKNHVTPLLRKLWKPKSDGIQLWVVGDIRKAFQFPKPWSEWNVLASGVSHFRIQLQNPTI